MLGAFCNYRQVMYSFVFLYVHCTMCMLYRALLCTLCDAEKFLCHCRSAADMSDMPQCLLREQHNFLGRPSAGHNDILKQNACQCLPPMIFSNKIAAVICHQQYLTTKFPPIIVTNNILQQNRCSYLSSTIFHNKKRNVGHQQYLTLNLE